MDDQEKQEMHDAVEHAVDDKMRWHERLVKRHQFLLIYIALLLTALLAMKLLGIT